MAIFFGIYLELFKKLYNSKFCKPSKNQFIRLIFLKKVIKQSFKYMEKNLLIYSSGSRISLGGGGANSQSGCANLFFWAENCMKLKEFGPPGASLALPLDPPLICYAMDFTYYLKLHLQKAHLAWDYLH